MGRGLLLGIGLSFASTVAAISTHCPVSDICYSLSIPQDTVSTGSGDVFIQITGPVSSGWLSIAQGLQMARANYFVIYPNSAGNNLTLSTRSSSGHQMPEYNSAVSASLISGSGISSGKMTANILCSNCNTWSGGTMDFSSSNTNWIWAMGPGNSINSDSTSVTIRQHPGSGYGSVTFGSAAQGGNATTNPFLGYSASVAASQCSTGVASTSTAIAATDGGSDAITGSCDATSNGASTVGGGGVGTVANFHGLLSGAVYVFVFPVGGIIIRMLSFKHLWIVHGSLQTIGYAVYVIGMGLGIYLANHLHMFDNKHSVIGLVLVAALFFLPALGWIHHKLFVRRGYRTVPSYLHIWIGRICIPLGILNGVFGLQLAGQDTWKVALFGIVGGAIWLLYVASIYIGEIRRARTVRRKAQEYSSSSIELLHI